MLFYPMVLVPLPVFEVFEGSRYEWIDARKTSTGKPALAVVGGQSHPRLETPVLDGWKEPGALRYTKHE